MTLREGLSRLEAESRRRALSIAGLAIEIPDEDSACPLCLGPTVVQKSTSRRVVTLAHGPFVAHVTVRVCARDCRYPSGAPVTVYPAVLSRLVGPGCTFGYDVEVFVGLERLLQHRQREEIQEDLRTKYGIELSAGEVSLLILRFCDHLRRLHQRSEVKIREALRGDGGYPLHIDSTGEAGRGTLFVSYAGWRGWVLGAWKIQTERADQLTPRLREVKDAFGPPCAVMRDLGRAVTLAAEEFVSELKGPIPILACHQHFLRDVGEDLLRDDHDSLRNLFRRARVRPKLRTFARDLGRQLATKLPAARADVETWAKQSGEHSLPDGEAGLAAVRALAQWVLDSAHDPSHLGFPFERPYLELYRRCQTLRRAIDAYLRRPPRDRAVKRALGKLARVLEPLVTEPAFRKVAKSLAQSSRIFDGLRATLRLTTKSPLNPETLPAKEGAAELRDIRRELRAFARRLRRERPARGPAQDRRRAIDTVLDHLRRHGDSLWGHVIRLPREAGGGIRLVSRTNNQLEGFFHKIKHGERRRSGRKVLTDDLEHLPPEAALACNLTRPDYLELVTGSLDNLPECFAELDRSAREMKLCDPELHEPEPPPVATASLPRPDRRIVRSDSLRQRIEAAARSRAPKLAASTG